MEAGKGAQHQVERLEAAVEDARRKLAQAEKQLYAWRQGAEGERRTSEVLAELESAGWILLHDLHWPGRPFANIDHIAIGPTGIFVVDSKNWSGNVEVRAGVLRQNGYARTSECEGVAAAAGAVSAFLEPRHRKLVSAVLCLVGRVTPTSQPGLARVVGSADLRTTLTSGSVRLTAADVIAIGGYLRDLLDGARSPEQRTTAALASAGAAPHEPAWSRRRGPTRRPTSARATRRPAPTPRRNGVGRFIVAFFVVAFALFVLLPATLRGIADSVAPAPAVTPATTHSPAPAVGSSPDHT